MNKKLKIKIIIIILILITIIKIIQINCIENIRMKIEKFEKLESSYYKQISVNENQKVETSRIRKNELIKEKYNYISINNEIIKIINLGKSEILIIDNKCNKYNIEKYKNDYDIRLNNLPKIIKIKNDILEEIKTGNIFSIFNCFRIIYIIPTQYKDINCYKIKTTREVLYINKDTLYPVYLEYNQTNSNNKKEKIKIEYIFKENTVTDEDIKIPDLSNYKLVEN